MSKSTTHINAQTADFLSRQHVFFVATAPDAPDSHLNLSPKGVDTFRVLDPKRVAYLDLTGSGIETVAHLRQNGRIVLMFCAFEGPPKIIRLYGKGQVIEPNDPAWPTLRETFPPHAGARAIITIDVTRVATSCGYGVPQYEFQSARTKLTDFAETKGPKFVTDYQFENNRQSIDGLPGLRSLESDNAS